MSDKDIVRDYVRELAGLLGSIDLTQLERAVEALRSARSRGATIYILGNGGSAATASHFATDLGKVRQPGTRPYRVVSLASNTAWITALANDLGYEHSFSGQLENFLSEGDILVAISASGNSANVVRAVELAKAKRVTTVGMLAFDGGALLPLVDIPLHVRSAPGRYGPAEDVHLAIQHMISSCLQRA